MHNSGVETRKGPAYKWLALLTVSIGIFSGTLDVGIVNIAFPTLTEIFETNTSVVVWVSVAYLLTSTGLMLTMGRLSGTLGRKKIYSLGFILLTVGLAMCPLAQNILQLILFRMVQGLGAAMIVAVGTAIVIAAFPAHERGKALGILGVMVSAGILTGPVLGGFLLDTLGWRSIFYSRVPLGLICLVMARLYLKEHDVGSTHLKLDLGGTFTLFVGLCCLLLCLNLGGMLGWTSLPAILLATSAVICLGLFLLVESRVVHPIVDLGLFRNPLFAGGNASLGIVMFSQAAVILLMPFYLIQGLGYSASKAGLLITIIPLTTATIGVFSGWLSDRIGTRVLCAAGVTLHCLALFRLSRLGLETSDAYILLSLVILGVGSGMFQSPNNSQIMGAVPSNMLGTASAMLATVRQIGVSNGFAIIGGVFASSRLSYATRLLEEGLSLATLPRLSTVLAFQDGLMIAMTICSIGIITSLIGARHRQHMHAVR